MMAERKEAPGDLLLAQFVRLQLIDNEAAQIPGLPRVCETASPMKAPWPFYMKALQAQLREVKNTIPPELQGNRMSNSCTAPLCWGLTCML